MKIPNEPEHQLTRGSRVLDTSRETQSFSAPASRSPSDCEDEGTGRAAEEIATKTDKSFAAKEREQCNG